jgi:hypothetical protein
VNAWTSEVPTARCTCCSSCCSACATASSALISRAAWRKVLSSYGRSRPVHKGSASACRAPAAQPPGASRRPARAPRLRSKRSARVGVPAQAAVRCAICRSGAAINAGSSTDATCSTETSAAWSEPDKGGELPPTAGSVRWDFHGHDAQAAARVTPSGPARDSGSVGQETGAPTRPRPRWHRSTRVCVPRFATPNTHTTRLRAAASSLWARPDSQPKTTISWSSYPHPI